MKKVDKDKIEKKIKKSKDTKDLRRLRIDNAREEMAIEEAISKQKKGGGKR